MIMIENVSKSGEISRNPNNTTRFFFATTRFSNSLMVLPTAKLFVYKPKVLLYALIVCTYRIGLILHKILVTGVYEIASLVAAFL
jgi:hypothetical protein